MRVTDCSKAGVKLDALSIQAGRLSLIKNAKPSTPLSVFGVPASLDVQVARANASWPTNPKSKCRFIYKKKLLPGQLSTVNLNACPSCYACMKEMGFNCTGDFKVRVSAIASKGAAYSPSQWADSRELQFECVAPGATCW